MDYNENLHIFSSFSYGSNNLTTGYESIKKAKNLPTIFGGIAKIIVGILEIVPFLGIFVALCEKKIKNWTIESQLHERQLFVRKEIESEAFQLQSLYFDTHSSDLSKEPFADEILKNRFTPEMGQLLDNSDQDKQVLSLIRDLKAFTNYHSKMTSKEKSAFDACIYQLEAAKKLAVVTTLLTESSTVREKEKLRLLLEKLFLEKTSSLKEGESAIIPCGYMNGNSYDIKGALEGKVNGHSIVLSIEKKNGLFNLKIFNTGDGIDNHERLRKDLSYVYPVCFERITLDTLQSQKFISEFTGFAYNKSDSTPYSATSIYNCFNAIFPGHRRAANPLKDKAYHTQGQTGNCTKKSLQVWLHEQLKKHEKLYQQFRHFRLDKQMKAVQHLLTKGNSNFRCLLPLRLGATDAISTSRSVAQSVAGFFLGSRISAPLPHAEVMRLKNYAQGVLEKRERKIGT